VIRDAKLAKTHLASLHRGGFELGVGLENQVADIEVGGRKASALTHSQVYEHEKALRDLTTWMKACAALRPPGDDLTT
jgi:hypothetical protein